MSDLQEAMVHGVKGAALLSGRIAALIVNYKRAFKPISPSFAPADMLVGAAASIGDCIGVCNYIYWNYK